MVTIIVILFTIALLQRVLPRFSVQRPVTTTMVFLGIILVGIISVSRLPQELFPSITYPQLTVVTRYANAAPEEIETLITKIIEEGISTVKNLKKIRSISKEGLSLVIADFNWGTNMNIAALNMREKIDLVKEMLPRDAEEPVVLKFNPYALPIMVLSVTGPQPPEELLRICKKVIKDKLEKLEGVARASITGGRERQIRVEIDQAALKASHIDLLKVVDALKNSNLNYPAGTTKEKFYEYLLRTMGEFRSVEDIRNTPVKMYDIDEEVRKYKEEKRDKSGINWEPRIAYKRRVIFVKDVAKVLDTFKEPTSYSRYNGKPNISISIQKQADANTIKTVKLVREELEHLKYSLPKGLKIDVVYDQSKFIKNSIRGVADAAWQGGILAFVVLLVFLRSVKNATIVTLSIPLSILATFSLMYFQGFTINMMSLGGLALGVGMLVDNAIVAVENIYRHMEMGYSNKEAAVSGTNQVSGPIIASTLTTVAVFLPMVFLTGVAGQIFKDLSFTIAFSLTASMFIAITLIPLLTSRGAGYTDEDKPSPKPSTAGFVRVLIRFDEMVLKQFMNHKLIGLGIVLIAFISALQLLRLVDKELMPKVDTGQFTLKLNMPTGTKLDVTDATVKKIERILLKEPDLKSVNVMVGSPQKTATEAAAETLGSHQAQLMISLKKNRKLTTNEFVQKIKTEIDKLDLGPAKVQYIMQESMFTAGGEERAPVVIKITGKELSRLNELGLDIAGRLSSVRGLYGIETTIAEASPETKIIVDKDKASLYGISVKDIAQTALIAVKGLVATKFKEAGNEYDILVRLAPEYRNNLLSLKGIQIQSPQGFMVPLDELAKLKRGLGPSKIKRVDQQRAIFVTAELFGRPLKDVTREIEQIIKGIKVPKDYEISLAGETEEARRSFRNLLFILILAFTLVYMIMASQFESLWQPFIIMFTVPFSIIGVAIALYLSHTSLNIVALLGVIILGGVVVNNGIVLVDYVNQMRAGGKELTLSAIEGSKIRLRPILMTASTTVLGLIPMAISKGEGAELRSPLAITVMGGLVLSTILTLWVIPVLYVIVADFLERLTGRKKTS